MNVFDRKTKFRHKYLASCDPDSQKYDYVKEEFGRRLVDRVFDIKRFVISLCRWHVNSTVCVFVLGCSQSQ